VSVMMIWTLGVDPTRIEEVHELVAARREQVQQHSCRDLRVYRVVDSAHDGIRMIAIEEFDSRGHLDAFRESQPHDDEAQATIARTFAPIGPFTVIDMHTVEELEAT
jgi:quinol monooxygenase YgiN